ncbi:MAG: winged helix DNA-binding protein [Gemmatimonadaceae bacterium]
MMSDDAGRETARQDEILELLYWLEGEGFHETATLAGISRFLVQEESAVAKSVERLCTRGYIAEEEGNLHLTPVGRGEAARRFADEFAPLLSQGHGECNDPTCDCHDNPAGAAECHARASGGHKH